LVEINFIYQKSQGVIMTYKKKWSNIRIAVLLFLILIFAFPLLAQDSSNWQIVVEQELAVDEAIKGAIEDLKKTGIEFGLKMEVIARGREITVNSILVGSPERNTLTKELFAEGKIELQGVKEPQGFEISTARLRGKKLLVVSGGSILGEVYGLFWLWDRLKVFRNIPDLNVIRLPELKIRFGGGGTKEAMRNALRYGVTWVSGGTSVNHLLPWDVEPERTTNEKNREEMRELIEYAHKLHLKFFVYEDEFSCHPTLLAKYGATLSPEDPAFWDAVQAKYRLLLNTMPEIDGIRIRTGELTRVGGNYIPFDVMHDGECCDWSLAKRYRTFVKKMYNVVVGEFGKIYFHRTWVTSAYEQHSMADVYKDIFTDDIPVKDLYLSPYLSTTDRYFHQPYNPTFNLTPHNMVVLLATLDYHSHSGVKTFATFPGQYFQAGLETILSPENSNVKGANYGTPNRPADEDWNTATVTAYSIYRLTWDHKENIKQIAKDFAAMHFGQKAAEAMAEIYLLSPNAYKYGLYIEPVSYGDFRSLQQLRLTTFPAKGLPRLDNGRKHMEFLHKLYLRCRPWLTETILYLDHGLSVADTMVEKFKGVKKYITDQTLAQEVENAINLTYWLIKSNNSYAKTFFAYFGYRDEPTNVNKRMLELNVADLKESMAKFENAPGFVYRLDGMEQLVINAGQVLEDLTAAEKKLASAPNDEEINTIISGLQKQYVSVLKKHEKEAVKLLSWQGRVDGRDLVKVKSDNMEIEHLRYDPIVEVTHKFYDTLPDEEFTVIPVDIQSRSFRPFVLEQPSKENDYTAVIYLSDYPEHGYSWWKFDLYYIPRSPKELGLETPW
jgi:hypothetical protein